MPWFLGIDTSNYTTSVAAWNIKSNDIYQAKKLLPVKEGALGLRQSDAVFSHVSQLYEQVEEILGQIGELSAVGVSVRPRDIENSYMPCFLVGKLVAQSIAKTRNIPCYFYSHQSGHIAAALFSAKALALLTNPLIAFHFSGGTTECVHVSPKQEKLDITVLYESSDLYAGQAVDRIGAMLGLAFPAGPALERLAERSEREYLPKPYFDDKGNPSLSGVQNQCQNMLEKGESAENIAKYALQYIAQVAIGMTSCVKERHPDLPIIYAGGVFSNQLIQREVREKHGGYFATPAFSADNAAGVAVLAGLALQKQKEIR